MADSKKKIVRLSTISHSLRILLRGQLGFMQENGFDIIASCSYSSDVEEYIKSEKIEYSAINISRKITPIRDLKSLIAVIKLLKKEKPEIIHTHSPKAGIIGMLAAWICRVPHRIHTVAGLPLTDETGVKYYFLRLIEKLTYACSTSVLPNSLSLKNYIVDNIYNSSKVQIIGYGSSNGINLDFFKTDKITITHKLSIRCKLGISDKDNVIVFVGRLASSKGIKELLESFQMLNRKNVKLLLVGPLDERHPLDNESSSILNNNPNIVCTGHVEDVRVYLSIGDIFVFPSYREGFPQALMQAVAMRLPCVATDINGCNEIITDGINGYLVPVRNSQALAQKMNILLLNPDIRKKFSEAGYNNLREKYSQEFVWNELLDFYKKKINEK